MYQVIALYGEYEPWWFFDDWKDDIVSQNDYATFQEASGAYQQIYSELEMQYPYKETKKSYLTAFWNETEIRYCEDCEDDIQLFHSIMLLKDDRPFEVFQPTASK